MGLRSEKEIRDELTKQVSIGPAPAGTPNETIIEICRFAKEIHDYFLKWVLEGEPCYSWDEWVEKIRENPLEEKSRELLNHYLLCTKDEIKTIQKVCDLYGTPIIEDLGTKPRYSVAELEKIADWIENSKGAFSPDLYSFKNEMIPFLKDSKKVQEVLKC